MCVTRVATVRHDNACMGTDCSPYRSPGYVIRCCVQRHAVHLGSKPPWPAHGVDGNLGYVAWFMADGVQ